MLKESFDIIELSDSNEDINIKSDYMLNYKGYFVEEENEDEDEPKYFEYGAHFPYQILYQKLKSLFNERNILDNQTNEATSKLNSKPAIRSRNNNNKLIINKSVYPYHNPIALKEEVVFTDYVSSSNLADKNASSQNNFVGSKVLMNTNNKFYNMNKANNQNNENNKTTIQIKNQIPKHKTFIQENTFKDINNKTREFSASFHKNIPNYIQNKIIINEEKKMQLNYSNHNNYKFNHKTDNQSLPKGFNNIFVRDVKKNPNVGSFGLAPQNTKIIRTQINKKAMPNQFQIKINVSNSSKQHYSNSQEKMKQNIKNSNSILNKTAHSTNPIGIDSKYNPNPKTNKQTTLKEINNIILSNIIGKNRQSRNKGKDNTLSKSKTNQSECESNLAQLHVGKNVLTQTQTISLDLLKQNKTKFNQPPKTLKINSGISKPRTYFDMKLNVKPSKAIIPYNNKQNVIKIKSLLYSNLNIKESFKPSNSNNDTNYISKQNNDNNNSNIKFNSPDKVKEKYFKSTSATSHHLSSVNGQEFK